MLTVLGLSDQIYINPCNGQKDIKWICRCDCGNIKHVRQTNLLRKDSGSTKACGCQRNKAQLESHYKHGEAAKDNLSRLYRTWSDMKTRCYNPKCKCYPNYGGRGIRVCDEWIDDFIAFKTWAENNGYNANLNAKQNSIDRIDVNGDYCPENCRWITWKEQCYNRRTNLYLEYNGERKTVTEWAKIVGIKWQTIAARVHRGWTDEEALTIPVDRDVRKIKDRREEYGASA